MPPKKQSSSSDDVASQFERIELGSSDVQAASPPARRGVVTVGAAEEASIRAGISTLLAHIDTLEAESTEPLISTVQIDAERLKIYSQYMEQAITKFVLLTSQGEAPVDKASDELRTHLSGTSCVLRALLAPSPAAVAAAEAAGTTAEGPGPTLRAQVLAVQHSLLSGVRALIKQLQEHLLARNETKLQVALTARVWESLEKQLRAVPLTNAHAVGKLLLAQCGLLRDAKQELGQLKQASAENDAAGDDDEDEDDFGEDDEDFDTLSAEEFALVPSCISMVNVAQQLVNAVYLYALKTAPTPVAASASASAAAAAAAVPTPAAVPTFFESSARIAWLESALQASRLLCQRVDTCVASVGGDSAETLRAINALGEQTRQIAADLVKHHNQTDGQKWPMGGAAATSSAAAAPNAEEQTPAWTQCEACASCVASVDPAAAGNAAATAPVAWLKKVVAAVHNSHSEAEAAAATAGI